MPNQPIPPVNWGDTESDVTPAPALNDIDNETKEAQINGIAKILDTATTLSNGWSTPIPRGLLLY